MPSQIEDWLPPVPLGFRENSPPWAVPHVTDLVLGKNIAPASGAFARDGPFVRQYDCSQSSSVVQLRGVVHSWIDCPDDPNLAILFLKAEPGGEKVMQSLRDMLVAQAYTSTVSPSASLIQLNRPISATPWTLLIPQRLLCSVGSQPRMVGEHRRFQALSNTHPTASFAYSALSGFASQPSNNAIAVGGRPARR